jgi:hypothetical protein
VSPMLIPALSSRLGAFASGSSLFARLRSDWRCYSIPADPPRAALQHSVSLFGCDDEDFCSRLEIFYISQLYEFSHRLGQKRTPPTWATSPSTSGSPPRRSACACPRSADFVAEVARRDARCALAPNSSHLQAADHARHTRKWPGPNARPSWHPQISARRLDGPPPAAG